MLLTLTCDVSRKRLNGCILGKNISNMVEELDTVQGKERFSYHPSKQKSVLWASLRRLIDSYVLALKRIKWRSFFRSDSVLIQFFCPSLFMYKSSRRNGALYVGILNYNASQIVSFDRKLVTCNRKLEWSSLVNTWIKRVMAMLRHGVWQDNLVLSTDALTKD